MTFNRKLIQGVGGLAVAGVMSLGMIAPAHAARVESPDPVGDAGYGKDIKSMVYVNTGDRLKFYFYMKKLTNTTKVTGVWSACRGTCNEFRAVRLGKKNGKLAYTIYKLGPRNQETQITCKGGVVGAWGLKVNIAWFSVPKSCLGAPKATQRRVWASTSPNLARKIAGTDKTRMVTVKAR